MFTIAEESMNIDDGGDEIAEIVRGHEDTS